MKELTYCKDCKNFIPVNTTQYICEEFGGYVDKDDFCSRGEKCEGETSVWYTLTKQGLAWLGRQLKITIWEEE